MCECARLVRARVCVCVGRECVSVRARARARVCVCSRIYVCVCVNTRQPMCLRVVWLRVMTVACETESHPNL